LGKNAAELIGKKQVIKTLIYLYLKSMFEAEEKNAEGFAECAIVTH
jgi:hypothetical protein